MKSRCQTQSAFLGFLLLLSSASAFSSGAGRCVAGEPSPLHPGQGGGSLSEGGYVANLRWNNINIITGAGNDHISLTAGTPIELTISGPAFRGFLIMIPGQPEAVIDGPDGISQQASGSWCRGVASLTHTSRAQITEVTASILIEEAVSTTIEVNVVKQNSGGVSSFFYTQITLTLRGGVQSTPEATPRPTQKPTPPPTPRPTQRPTPPPTPRPTQRPTPSPTPRPTPPPTPRPTAGQTAPSSSEPTAAPSFGPTESPSFSQTFGPSSRPSLFVPETRSSATPTSSPIFGPGADFTTDPTGETVVPAESLPSTSSSKWPDLWIVIVTVTVALLCPAVALVSWFHWRRGRHSAPAWIVNLQRQQEVSTLRNEPRRRQIEENGVTCIDGTEGHEEGEVLTGSRLAPGEVEQLEPVDDDDKSSSIMSNESNVNLEEGNTNTGDSDASNSVQSDPIVMEYDSPLVPDGFSDITRETSEGLPIVEATPVADPGTILQRPGSVITRTTRINPDGTMSVQETVEYIVPSSN